MELLTAFKYWHGFIFLAVACRDVAETVIFHRDNMIFPRNNYWRVDPEYRLKDNFILNDAFHDFKKLSQLFGYLCVPMAAAVEGADTLDLIVVPLVISLTHYVFFHWLLTKA